MSQTLPKQVRERAEESERLIAEQQAKNNPTAEPTTNNGKPADEPEKIDPENYKERFAKYKQQTDKTISTLRTELGQLTGNNEALTQKVAD